MAPRARSSKQHSQKKQHSLVLTSPHDDSGEQFPAVASTMIVTSDEISPSDEDDVIEFVKAQLKAAIDRDAFHAEAIQGKKTFGNAEGLECNPSNRKTAINKDKSMTLRRLWLVIVALGIGSSQISNANSGLRLPTSTKSMLRTGTALLMEATAS
jgi:hypothetical protein